MTSSPGLTPVLLDPAMVRGALELETTDRGLLPHRLPAWARVRGADQQLLMAESQPAGVRLALRTAASLLELDTVPTKRAYAGAPPRPDGTYELVVDGEVRARATAPGGDTLVLDLAGGTPRTERGDVVTVRLEVPGPTGPARDVEVWLPHDESTVLVDLRADAPVSAAPASGRPVWLHHGSSISHGSNATYPTGTWPAVAARRAGVELVNLGYGGGALLDPFVARAVRDTPADLISLKLGINLVNADLMRLRALGPAVHGFLDTIRDGHPDTPLLVVSSVLAPIHEHTPGPAAVDPAALGEGRVSFVATGDPEEVAQGRLTLTTVREELRRVVEQRRPDDPHLGYLDGRELYGEADAETHPLPDALHPDADTHVLIGERFADLGLAPLLRRLAAGA